MIYPCDHYGPDIIINNFKGRELRGFKNMTTSGVGDGKRLTKEFICIHAQSRGTDKWGGKGLGWGGGWMVGDKRGKRAIYNIVNNLKIYMTASSRDREQE